MKIDIKNKQHATVYTFTIFIFTLFVVSQFIVFPLMGIENKKPLLPITSIDFNLPVIEEEKPVIKVSTKKESLPALLKAVVHVESRGKAFDKNGAVTARFERFWFKRCLKIKGINKRVPKRLVHQGLNKDHRVIAEASKINKYCAYFASSWGKSQLMGMHYPLLGYDSPYEMASDFSQGDETQEQATLEFIKRYKNGKAYKALKNKNWRKFALIYNGKNYKKNRYHTKLREAYLRLTKL
jgi:hypothetical protein